MGLRGPRKGAKYKPTITKEAAREALRAIVLREIDSMTAAQIAHAKGLKYLVTRNKKTGKFERVTKERMEHLLTHPESDDDLETIEVWDKDPSTPAFTDLLNRALDKPKEQEQEIRLSGDVNIVSILRSRQARQIADKSNKRLDPPPVG